MFEKYLQKILKQHLGEFIEQIDSRQLNVGVFSGKIDIKNVKLRKSLLQKYHLPIIIKHSSIKGLSLKIPWKSLFSSPLLITIDSILILCQFAGENIKGEERVQAMLEMVNSMIKLVGQDLVERGKDKSELKEKSGLIDGLAYKIFDNLYLSIKNIHLRFEERDGEGPLKYGYSFGCSLQSIDVFAVGPNNEKVFIDRSKLQGQQLIRKRIEMKNLSIYCNYGETDFITQLIPIKQDKIMEEKLLHGIYTRERFNSDQNKNNYILIMNVLGVMDEDHRESLVSYDLKLNFEKLIVKLDKEVLNCLLVFGYKMGQLNERFGREITRREPTIQDDLLLRKYCNAYLSDFKVKDYWGVKDKEALSAVLLGLRESAILDKIKYIIINQVSMSELSKFFAVKGQDLEKGLLQVSKQIKGQAQPKFKMQILVPQITLYLVNQFSQSILELNVLSISVGYFQRIVDEKRIKYIDLSISNISAINNGLYILSADQQGKNQKFYTSSVEITPEITNIIGKVTSFNFHYDFQTIFKINELFHLREVDNKCRNMAADRIQQLQQKINAKVKEDTKVNLRIVFSRPKILIRQGKVNWTISVNQMECLYADKICVNLQSFRIMIYRQKEQYLFIEPFNVNSAVSFIGSESKIGVKMTAIVINCEYFIYASLSNLNKYLFINKKNQIISKSTKSCEVFLKQNRWKKCFITLLDNRLYAWQNQNEYPLFNIRIRVVEKAKRGKIDILQISNKKKVYEIAFKDQKLMQEWMKELTRIAQTDLEEKSLEIIEIHEDSRTELDFQLESLLIKLNHHKLNKEQKEFARQVEAVTSFELQKLEMKLESSIESNIKRSRIAISLENLKFGQNQEEFIEKVSKQQHILNVSIISDPTSIEKCDQLIILDVQSVRFFFNSSALLRFLGFFHDIQSKNRLDDINYQQTLQQQNPYKVLTKVNINISNISIVFQNKITSLPMFKLSSELVAISLIIKYYEIDIQANLKSISLHDLTNYPFTVYDIKTQKQTVPRLIVDQKNHNEIAVCVKLLSEGSPSIVNGVTALANATISNLTINYIHEVIMRIIDYLNNQILGLLYYADLFPQFYCEKQLNRGIAKQKFRKTENELLRMKYIKNLGKQKLKKMIETSKPLSFNIALKNSTLNVMNDYTDNNSISFHIENTMLSNTLKIGSYQTNLGKVSAPFEMYLIELKDITLFLREKEKEFRISKRIGETNIDFKITVQYFGSEMDYRFMLGDDLKLHNFINVDFQISMAKLHLNQQILSNVLKAINRNIFQQDGVNFLMIYEFFQGVESLLNVVIHSQLLMIELKRVKQAEHILTEIGGFLYKYDRNPQKVTKIITSKYTIFNFVNEEKDEFKEILTSRKIFGRVSNRGTYYTQLFKQNLLINIPQNTSFQYQSIRDRQLKKVDSVLSAKEMMGIIDIKCFFYIQGFELNHEETETLPPAYKNAGNELKLEQDEESTKIKLDKILLCAEVPDSEIIISVLATIYLSIDFEKTQVVIPDLEAFISSSEYITCSQLAEMKKRTLLKQTHLKILKSIEFTQINLGKCFFKISINDVKSLNLVVSQFRHRYYEFITHKKNRFGDDIESVQSVIEDHHKQQIYDPKLTSLKQALVVNSSEKIKVGSKPHKEKLQLETSLDLISLEKQKQKSPRSLSPKSSIESMSTVMIYNLDTVELMLVDDLNDFLTPLIYINLKLDLNQQKKATIELYAQYFNLRNTLWEPLIEKNVVMIDYRSNLVIRSVDPKEFININVASNFIQNIFKTINHKELKSSRLFYTSHKVDKDEINSWIIINQLGEDIICEPIDENSEEKSICVKKGEAQTLSFLSKETSRQFKQKENQDLFIKLTIDDKMVIKKLKINQLGLKRLNLSTGDVGSITIIKNLYIDLSKNIKYLTLSSEFIFENKSDITIRLKQSKYNRFLYLLPFKSASLPYYCNLNSIIFSPHQNEEEYQSFYNLEHHSKLEINNKMFNISFANRKFKKYFTLIPLYKITNFLPFQIIINFKAINSDSLYCSLSLSSYQNQNGNYGFLYKPLQELEASIWIENYQCTDFITIKKFIEVRDYNNNILTIKSEVSKDPSSPMVHIALMVNYIIRNQTSEIFDAFVDNHWIRHIQHGQYFISQNNHVNFILSGQKSDLVYLTKKSSSITLRNKGNEMFRSESDYCLYKNRIEFDASIENKLNFFISQLLPMYLVKNDNKYPIILKQNGSGVGQSQLVQGKASQNIKWFLDSNNKRKNPLFKFTLMDSPYEWSCLINVQSIRKSYLVLRNKFNYIDIKYFVVNVKKIKETFEIYCKELSHSEIPYIIRNNTKNYNIFVENLKIILKPGEQSYFCWEDPSINQKKIKIKIYRLGVSLQKEGMKSHNKEQFINYEIKVESFEQDPIKSSDSNLDIEVINLIHRQVYVFSDDPKDGIKTLMMSSISLELPIRIALINNSTSPASHIFDLTTYLTIHYETFSTNKTSAYFKLNEIQLDNQTKPLTYFPVVLSSNLQFRVEKSKNLEVEVLADIIRISIEEDFLTDLTAFLAYLQSLTASPSNNNQVLQQQVKEQAFFISKLILPKLTVELQIQTKKFSIQTTITLQKPEITSYPWVSIPYPIKTIAFNILSHLSISPWAFISSFGKGLSMLITEQETSKGFEGFFQQLIGGFSNSINGMVGMIVGHDIQKVDNFIDGLNKGLWALGTSLYEILPNFQGDYSPINIIKEVGTSVVNLVFKPVTGILRMTLRVSEGIKKTTKFQFDFTSKRFKKRFPIVFFHRQETFYTYDLCKSQLMNTIKRALINQLKYFYLIDIIQIEYKLRNEKSCLIIGAEQLLLFNIKTEKMIWKVQIQKISSIEVHNLCTIQFILSLEHSQDHKKKYQVDINSQDSAKRVIEIIEKAKKMSSIEL